VIKYFAADGTVKREWPEGLHAACFERDGKRFASVAKSNAIETVELADGEQVGETLHAADVSPNPVAAAVHPIEAALAAIPNVAALVPVELAPETADVARELAHATVVSLHSQSAPFVDAPAICGSTLGVIAADACFSSSCFSTAAASAVQATHSTEAVQIPTSEAKNG
jgi:hypothetical protein